MKILKKKSLTKDIPDDKIELLGSTRFMSFEAAIGMFGGTFGINEIPTGYVITEQGIIIKYD